MGRGDYVLQGSEAAEIAAAVEVGSALHKKPCQLDADILPAKAEDSGPRRHLRTRGLRRLQKKIKKMKAAPLTWIQASPGTGAQALTLPACAAYACHNAGRAAIVGASKCAAAVRIAVGDVALASTTAVHPCERA